MPSRPAPRFPTPRRSRNAARSSSAIASTNASRLRYAPSSRSPNCRRRRSCPAGRSRRCYPVTIYCTRRRRAQTLGYEVVIDNACDDWDYADAAAIYWTASTTPAAARKTLPALRRRSDGTPGPGAWRRWPQPAIRAGLRRGTRGPGARPMVVLSAGSDGIDGNSPAAGAIADATTVARGQALESTPNPRLPASTPIPSSPHWATPWSPGPPTTTCAI